MPITDAIREILWPLRGHHQDRVFTYVAQQTRGDMVRGERYPITKSGLKQLTIERENWERISGVIARVLSLQGER